MPLFEVAIYNSAVRQIVEEGGHHAEYKDDWADIHYFEYQAVDENDARKRSQLRHPAHQGFVITDVARVKGS
jgi:hypothetical protein